MRLTNQPGAACFSRTLVAAFESVQQGNGPHADRVVPAGVCSTAKLSPTESLQVDPVSASNPAIAFKRFRLNSTC